LPEWPSRTPNWPDLGPALSGYAYRNPDEFADAPSPTPHLSYFGHIGYQPPTSGKYQVDGQIDHGPRPDSPVTSSQAHFA